MSIHVRIQNTWLPAKVADKNTQAVRYFFYCILLQEFESNFKTLAFFFSPFLNRDYPADFYLDIFLFSDSDRSPKNPHPCSNFARLKLSSFNL